MTRTILVAGTASHVGKSTIAAGLCRHLADRGVSVAPFKAQNMSNNARVVVRADAAADRSGGKRTDDEPAGGDPGDDRIDDDRADDDRSDDLADDPAGGDRADDPDSRWGEIGVSQFVQARAARITPTTDQNPVLLKPRGEGESQLVLGGRAIEHVPPGEYYDDYWADARNVAEAAHRRLAADHEVVIAEGAGSIAEINLHDRDLANVETARFADAEIILLVDIERGGAFASLYGTLELLPADLRERVVGSVVTKFRGDPSLLEPGIAEIEERTGVPVLGVVPYDDPGLPEEDSVGLPATEDGGVRGADDGTPDDRCVTIAVPRLPRISNATDLEALAAVPGVRVAYVPIDRRDGETGGSGAGSDPLSDADAVVLPGTKNTVDDLLALREAGFDAALERFDGPIVGVCGGYQQLGRRITNADLEGTGDREVVEGIGLLPVETEFSARKRLERTTVEVTGAGPIDGASGTASGYEIHAGRTRLLEDAGDVARPLGPGSVATDDVLGTYLHGLFDEAIVREAFLETVFERSGTEPPAGALSPGDDRTAGDDAADPYDRAAALVRDHVDLRVLGPPFVDE